MSFLEHSREPLRPLVDGERGLAECLDALGDTSGPVAFDTERAHGHRYWPKAYLLQIRRPGAGTWLLDPVALHHLDADLGALVAACTGAGWILHAASQDLPCMQELDIVPPRVFDTELAARLLGKPSAGLGPLLDSELGIKVRKAHSADNWSKRPLPESWLTYAALDVDYLVELADSLREQLAAAGRLEWVEQESAEELNRYGRRPPTPRADPWRRLNGLATLRTPRQLAVARALWEERDSIAQRRDRPPTWILADAAIIEAATRSRDSVLTRSALVRLPAFAKPSGQRHLNDWVAALDRVRELPEQDYPPRRTPHSGVPHPRSWDRANPEAAQRWAKVRPAVDELACDLGGIQASLVAPPQVLQEALFSYAMPGREELLKLGARPWQVDFLAPLIAEQLG